MLICIHWVYTRTQGKETKVLHNYLNRIILQSWCMWNDILFLIEATCFSFSFTPVSKRTNYVSQFPSGNWFTYVRRFASTWFCTSLEISLLSASGQWTLLEWSVHTCLTQLYDGRDIRIIYYIMNNYMFRHFSLAIFRLINEKILVSSYTRLVCCIQWGGKRWSGYEISHVLCRKGGVGMWDRVFLLFQVNIVGSMVSIAHVVF
jgi:hypothetical protein